MPYPPPATEKASGKFDAPNTATGPMGRCTIFRSGRGRGVRSGRAGSWRRSSQPSFRIWSANSRNCPLVRPRSPFSRASGRPVSLHPISEIIAPRASISSAMQRKKAARSAAAVVAKATKAASAARHARSTSSGMPTAKSWAAPWAGEEVKLSPPPTHSPAIRCFPVSMMSFLSDQKKKSSTITRRPSVIASATWTIGARSTSDRPAGISSAIRA